MAGFLPVGSFPVASVPAGGGLSLTIPAGLIRVRGYGYTLAFTYSATRVTWIGVEVLHSGVYGARNTWIGAEVLHSGLYEVRNTWIGVEVLRSIDSILVSSDEGGAFILWG